MKKDSLETQPKDPRRDIFTKGWPLRWLLNWESLPRVRIMLRNLIHLFEGYKEAAGGRR